MRIYVHLCIKITLFSEEIRVNNPLSFLHGENNGYKVEKSPKLLGKIKKEPMKIGPFLVELRGFEPLISTLPV